MVKVVKGQTYERAEATFNTKDNLDMEIYNFLIEQSKVIGKSNYLKQLVYKEMLKSRD